MNKIHNWALVSPKDMKKDFCSLADLVIEIANKNHVKDVTCSKGAEWMLSQDLRFEKSTNKIAGIRLISDINILSEIQIGKEKIHVTVLGPVV